MATREKVLTELRRLDNVFAPRVPVEINGVPNRGYGQYLEIYTDALMPFSDYEVERGIKDALEQYKFQKWPTPAELREFCMAHHKRVATHNLKGIADLREDARQRHGQEEFSPEHRELMAERFNRMMKAIKFGLPDGTPYGRDYEKDRAWVYRGICQQAAE